jgi:hypothetical protein
MDKICKASLSLSPDPMLVAVATPLPLRPRRAGEVGNRLYSSLSSCKTLSGIQEWWRPFFWKQPEADPGHFIGQTGADVCDFGWSARGSMGAAKPERALGAFLVCAAGSSG